MGYMRVSFQKTAPLTVSSPCCETFVSLQTSRLRQVAHEACCSYSRLGVKNVEFCVCCDENSRRSLFVLFAQASQMLTCCLKELGGGA